MFATLLPWIAGLAVISAAGLLLHIALEKSEDIGSLKSDNQSQEDVLSDVQKANAARNDPANLKRVRDEFSRD